MKRIEYQKGEIVGNYGVVFVERIKTRKARFECFLCKNEFVADIANVKAIYGHTNRRVSFNSKKNYYQAAIRLGNKVKYIMAAKNPLTCAILYDNFVKDNNLPHKLNFG